MTTLSRKQNFSRYHFNIACSIYLCYNNRDPILVNHPLFPFSFTVQFSITCKLSLLYRDNIMKFTTRNRLIWYTICENETFNFSNSYSILIEKCGQKQTSAIKRTNRLNMDFVYPQEIPQNKSSNLSHGPIFAMDTLSTGSTCLHQWTDLYIKFS